MKAKSNSKRRNAFTLVEILIVVVILGILAAIVVPQFANATDDARQGNVVSQIQTLENQIELFRARTGAYPDLVGGDWAVLIAGDYIKDEPENPYVTAGDATAIAADASAAWQYTVADGTLVAVGAP